MYQLPTLGRAPRLIAAVFAAGVTWAVLQSVVALDAGDHARLVAASAQRQKATAVAFESGGASAPRLVAVASAH